ncbi:presqualene diphosphate synthase HpnD [Candidatus Methylopumilus planktonicus]|uniref:presqualene diphosphate synthase HpnD n=1 Tax=Candidatus Methylopumilus planktonicus TaxID=1581557 RepID=UPI003BEF1E9B
MTPIQYCYEKVKTSKSNFTWAFYFISQDRRDALISLYAFCREIDDIVDETLELEVATAKINWWKAEINRLFHETPQHPVTKSLSKFIHIYELNEAYFIEMLDGMEMDLKFNRYENFKQLQLYCYRVAGVVGILSVKILGFKNQATLKYAHDLGIALQLTNIIRDVGEDARKNRIYIPLDELKEFSVSEDEILKFKESNHLSNLMFHQIARAEVFYKNAYQKLPKEDINPQIPGLIMGKIYETLLLEIKRDKPEQTLNHKVLLPPFRKVLVILACFFKNKFYALSN